MLRSGHIVGIVAPGYGCAPDILERVVQLLRSWNLTPRVPRHSFSSWWPARISRACARAVEYLKLLRLYHQVDVVGDRFSTVELSTGQRKRLALVASYLEDRPILLFDEWAAEQEPGLKRFFYEDLLPQLRAQGRTAIVITHDDAFFERADVVIKLDTGKRRILEACEHDCFRCRQIGAPVAARRR